MKMLKHTGYVVNTSKKCVIVMLELPEKPGYCLIAETDSLPERIHDPLMNLLMTQEAQNSKNLADILHRRFMPDTNRSILMELHLLGYLRAEKTTNIMVVPRNNVQILASDLIEAMKKISENPNAEFDEQTLLESKKPIFEDNKKIEEKESKIDIAKNLLLQAELLERDAENLRKKAYTMVPELKVVEKTKNKKVKEEKEENFKETKEN